MQLPYWPNELPHPSPDLLKSLRQSLTALSADSLMLWLYLDTEDSLLAVYNPTLPNLCGFKQPLAQGTISQVALTGLPILERNLKDRSDHDPTLDQLHQHTSKAMIAAPVATSEGILGILSAVQFDDSSQDSEFQLSHLDALTLLGTQIGIELSPSQT